MGGEGRRVRVKKDCLESTMRFGYGNSGGVSNPQSGMRPYEGEGEVGSDTIAKGSLLGRGKF